MPKRLIELVVNQEHHELAVNDNDTLLEVLRENLGTGGDQRSMWVWENAAPARF